MAQLPRTSTAEHSRATHRLLACWIVSVLLLWSFAHALSRWVFMMDENAPALRFAWWTAAKVVAWLLPTWIWLRRCGGASARWLGLTTTRGLGVALLWSVLWIAAQELGGWLQLPLFSRPPAGLAWYSLIGSLVIAPIFEELMFRGAMLRAMQEAGNSRRLCVTGSAIAFAMLHVPGWIFRRGLDASIAGAFLSMCAFGIVAGMLAWRAPSLWAPIFFHAANNFWSTGALAFCIAQIS